LDDPKGRGHNVRIVAFLGRSLMEEIAGSALGLEGAIIDGAAIA
jgi:hypothetical protein